MRHAYQHPLFRLSQGLISQSRTQSKEILQQIKRVALNRMQLSTKNKPYEPYRKNHQNILEVRRLGLNSTLYQRQNLKL